MIVFSFPDYQEIANNIATKLGATIGDVELRNFPEGESYVRIKSEVANQEVVLVCGLDNPNNKIAALMFFVHAAKEFGAKKVGLVAPYLGYMRLDKRFNPGEAITSNIFAEFLSKQIDWLVTIDPHLHRHKTLEEIYSIPCQTLHATQLIANWIKNNVTQPLLVGPDAESEQWVSDVAQRINADFIVLNKLRHGDFDVQVSIPEVAKYQNHTPILVDDIISTARTMIETVKHLQNAGMMAPICIGVHGIFAGDAYENLKNCPVQQIISCNTIKHFSNAIDVTDLLVEGVKLIVNKNS